MLLARNVSAEGRSRAFVGGASVPVSQLAEVAEPLVAVHGQADQHRLLQPRAQREALDAFGGETIAALLATYRAPPRRPRSPPSASWPRWWPTARERAREADLLRFGLGEIEAVAPAAGRGGRARRGGAAPRSRRHPAHRRRVRARRAVLRRGRSRRPGRRGSGAHPARRRTRPRLRGRRARRPGRRAHLPALRRRGRRRVVRLRPRDRPRPPVGRLRAARGADGAHPQVRRDRGRGAGVGRVVRGPPGPARRHRRPDRPAPRAARRPARSPRTRRPGPVRGPHRDRCPALRRADRRARPAGDAARRARGASYARARPTTGSPVGGRTLRFGSSGVDEVDFLLAANTGSEPRPLAQGCVGRRAVAGDARARGRPGRHQPGADLRLRRGRQRGRRQGGRRGRPPPGEAGGVGAGARRHPPAAGRGVRRPPRRRREVQRRLRHHLGPHPARRRRAASASCRGCSPGWRSPRPRWPTPASYSRRPADPRSEATRERHTRLRDLPGLACSGWHDDASGEAQDTTPAGRLGCHRHRPYRPTYAGAARARLER